MPRASPSSRWRFPFPGSRPAYCLGLRAVNAARERVLSLPKRVDPDCDLQPLPAGSDALTQIVDPECEAKVMLAEGQARDPEVEARSYYVRFTNEMAWTRQRLQCSGLYNLGPQDLVPPLTTLMGVVNDRIGPYALWLLPALYGAMGAMLFHLRLILNPLQPDPPLARLILRLSLGALAGIVLTWFVTPDSRLDLEVADVGFTLFGFAFLFGFSLDVFFAILDRFVAVSVASIQRLGAGSGGGPSPT